MIRRCSPQEPWKCGTSSHTRGQVSENSNSPFEIVASAFPHRKEWFGLEHKVLGQIFGEDCDGRPFPQQKWPMVCLHAISRALTKDIKIKIRELQYYLLVHTFTIMTLSHSKWSDRNLSKETHSPSIVK